MTVEDSNQDVLGAKVNTGLNDLPPLGEKLNGDLLEETFAEVYPKLLVQQMFATHTQSYLYT